MTSEQEPRVRRNGNPDAENRKKAAKQIKKIVRSRPESTRLQEWWDQYGHPLTRAFQRLRDPADEPVSVWDIIRQETNWLEVIGNTFDVDERFADHLVASAAEDPTAFDLASEICSTNVLYDGPLPDSLRFFAHKVLAGDSIRPTARGRPAQNWYRDLLIIEGVEGAVRLGFPASMNTASDPNRHCGVTLVQNALGQVWSAPLSIETIDKIWKSKGGLAADRDAIERAGHSAQAIPKD